MSYLDNKEEAVNTAKNDYLDGYEETKLPKKRNIIIISIISIAMIAFIALAVYNQHIYNQHVERIRPAQECLNEINTYCEQKDYSAALHKIDVFKLSYSELDEDITSQVNTIFAGIEDKLYEHIKDEKNLSDCQSYLNKYKDGKYIDDVMEICVEASNQMAEDNIQSAKTYIEKGNFFAADSLLSNVISSTWVSQENKNNAQQLANGIAQQVSTIKQLLGSWESVTGNHSTWTYTSSQFIITFEDAFPGDTSAAAEHARKNTKITVDYQLSEDYILYKMGNVSYRNRFRIEGDEMFIQSSVDGTISKYVRKK